ncbi:hypothetical protein jhhlp_006125 [Lomentospora prolificans]|uniref:SAM domain-containing protein n=1 Tax=Lomentospora prolificans TaxID=41688 RepID=A0A2N3N505_9PEZI|nr:hypothetical protein jhhlp_006125 [Lomentospora prolificans]
MASVSSTNNASGLSSPSGNPRPEVGDILQVIHDFNARSADELNLAKGDRVQLIERDDEFGDGWFLGRHMVNNNTGLFPEVYTRPTAKTITPSGSGPSSSTFNTQPLTPLTESVPETSDATTPNVASSVATSEPSIIPSVPNTAATADAPISTPSIIPDSPPATLPLSSVAPKPEATSPPPTQAIPSSVEQALARLNSNQDSHVLNETLNVIDEHITDLRSPVGNDGLHAATDSGSEYSAPIDHRMSYIQGEETDEEEDSAHTRAEVEKWNPDQVAEYLFTAGVEKHHCEVFRDQEISGEVLLGMDQSSLFIKALDLGSVGRRLKTWQKIKTLQDEVNSGTYTRRTTQTYGSEVGSDDTRRMRSRTNTLTNSTKMQTIDDRPPSAQAGRRSTGVSRIDPTSFVSPTSPTILESPTRAGHGRRPSAASVRDLHHSRRHSSTDYRGTPVLASPNMAPPPPHPVGAEVNHKKQASFDRNWTMGSAYNQRPLSSTGFQDILNPGGGDLQGSATDLDRGYFSGTEVDGRKKNVLKKRDSGAAKASYTEEQRVRSATAISRHSRYGSIDSVREGGASSAVQKYYGLATGSHRRTASTNTQESIRPIPPAKDVPPPTVTKLDGISASPLNSPASQPSPANRGGSHSDWLSSVVNKPVGSIRAAGLGLRAISDSVSSDRTKVASPTESSTKESPVVSPARTGSTTPSAGHSFDLDSAELKASAYGANAKRDARKKGKKETSAYTRGLQKTSPREAMTDADYSGWMKKKSSNLMTMWKPRLFVLKGRRLAYYYSEDDTQEKGLIDISFHRVLPADNERLTGLHATITGAGSSTPTLPNQDGSGADASGLEKGDDTMFIFKLVPPRSGLPRAVNFTKPTVHYFAVPNLKQGRLWMAALMKATIDRDDTQPITTTYQQKTISLAKARAMRHRPPALMNLDEGDEEEKRQSAERQEGLGIALHEADSGISGLEKMGLSKVESAKATQYEFNGSDKGILPPQSA